MCSGFSDVPVIVLEEGNDLWNCLSNWCSKLSLRLISEWPHKCFMEILRCSDSFNNAFTLAHCVYVLLCWRRATICGIASLIDAWNWAFRLISAWPYWWMVEISHCSDSFDNAFAPAPWVTPSSCFRRAMICGIASLIDAWNWAFRLISAWLYWWMVEIWHCSDSFDNASAPAPLMIPLSCFRRAMICGMASPIGPKNSASKWYQHSLSDALIKSHIVQTVSTMHLHQQVGCPENHPEGGQWSGGLPP